MNTTHTAETLRAQFLGYNPTFKIAGDMGTLCRSDDRSTWFKFADGSIICFDKVSDGNYEITTCDC